MRHAIEERRANMQKELRCRIGKQRKNKEKVMHGQFIILLNKNFGDKKNSMERLHSAVLKGETETLIMSARNQAFNTRYQQKNILEKNIDSR